MIDDQMKTYGKDKPLGPLAPLVGETVKGPNGEELIPPAILMPAASGMKDLDVTAGPPMPLGVDPASLTRMDLDQMKAAGLIESYTEDNDTGAYHIQFAEPLPRLELSESARANVTSMVDRLAKDGEKS